MSCARRQPLASERATPSLARCSRALPWIAATCLVRGALGDDAPDCEDHPGGCRCYYDALAFGCPSSLGYDSRIFLCSCDYGDNTWLNVLTNFLWAFRTAPAERPLLAQKFDVRLDADGILSMDVGYAGRVQCGAPVAKVYPGTNFELDIQELYQLAGNLIVPQVRGKMAELCPPGRLALQLLCLHAELGLRDGHAAAAYAAQVRRLWPMVGDCVDRQTPWPFPGIGAYLEKWKSAKLPSAGEPLAPEAVAELSWWPDPATMRGKTPEESESHYWPCAPLQDRLCFPPGTNNLHMSCEHCCDPAKGPTGEAACFVGEFTFARCCRTPGGTGRFY